MTEQVIAPILRGEDWRREALIAAAFGAIPVLGVLFWNWSPLALLLLFGFENLVIGVRQVAMMTLVARARPPEALGAFGQAMFFVIHYGAFCAAHIFFSVVLVYVMGPDAPPPEADGAYAIDLHVAFANAWQTIGTAVLGIIGVLAFQALQMVEFVRAREAETVTLNRLMAEPYVRLMVLHVVIIVGAGLVLNSGLPPQVFVVLALYKLAVDVGEIWWRAHRKRQPATPAELPAPKTGVAFDVTKATPGTVFYWVGGAFFCFGLLGMLFGDSFWAAFAFTAFAAVFIGFAAFNLGNMHRKLVRSLTDGSGKIVEGRVENFVASSRTDAVNETFTVSGVRFVYVDNVINGGFNKTAFRGGPIREGLHVRIHYRPTADWQPGGNVITRLEVLS
jgi:hypothetical protein